MASVGSVIAQLDLDQGTDIDGVKAVLQFQVQGVEYVASYWSSALKLRVVFSTTLTGSSQLFVYSTGATGLATDTFSTWQPGAYAPTVLSSDPATASALWATYSLLTSEGTPVSGTQITLARESNGSALYVPAMDNTLAVNHPASGSVTLVGDLVQDHAVTLLSSLEDADILGDLSYLWQTATSATAADGNWVAIDSANADQFTPTANEANLFLRVKVSYVDSLGYEESVVSAASPTAVIPNQAPAAGSQTVFLATGEVYTFKAADFPFNDADSNDTLQGISLLTLPLSGELTFKNNAFVIPTGGYEVSAADLAAGYLQFTPAANSTEALHEELGFVVIDSKNTASSALEPGLLVLEDTHRPTSNYALLEGVAKSPIGILPGAFSFSDIDGDSFQSITVTQLPLKGALTLGGVAVAQGQVISWESMYDLGFSYTPKSSGTNFDHLKFKVSDGKVESSSAYDLQFNVTPADGGSGGVDVSGQVVHWKGLSPVPISGVTVAIGANTPAVSDATGQFTVANADLTDSSQINPSVETPFSTKADAGISLTDVLAALKVYLGKELPSDYASPFNLVAADFDANGVVNLSDVLGLLKYYLNRPVTTSPSWAFVDAADVVTVNGQQKIMGLNGYLTKTDAHLDTAVVAADPSSPITLIGVVRGDVDGSWALAHPAL